MNHKVSLILILTTVLLVSIVPLSAQDTIECEAGFRLFEHEMLITDPVCIPEDPERIALAWPLGLPSLFRADAPLVGSFALDFLKGQYPDWAEEIDTLTDIGNPPNPEALLALEPDLIIGPYWFLQDEDTSNYPEAVDVNTIWTSIAPTIAFDWNQTTWRETEELLMEAAGKTDEIEAILAEFEARADELAALIGDVENIEISMINFGAGFFNLHTQNTPGAMVAEMIGFGRPDAHLLPVSLEEFAANRDDYPGYINEGYLGVSLENLDVVDADVILISGGVFENNPDNQAALDELLENPLWQTLNAVQNGNIYIANINFGNGDIAAAHFMLDEFAAAFDVADEFSSNPYAAKAPIPELDIAMEGTEEASAGDFPMTIAHELGTTTIDATPERIVVLEYSFADHLGTLDIAPVGFAVDAPPEYIYEYTSDVGAIEVGTRAEPNLEAILELDPDLIIADLRRHEAIYDQLSLIAPTVVFNGLRGSYTDQLDQFSIIADMLGKGGEAAEILANYQQTFDETAALTSTEAGQFVIGVLWSGGFTAHSDESFMGSFLESLGRTNALAPEAGETQYLLDMEGFASVNPNAIVILCNPADQEFLDNMTDGALWQAFAAVTNERVYTFDRNLWSKGRGITAFELILADAVNSGLLTDTASAGTACGGVLES